MSELSFLIELLLNHKLPKVTRDLVAQRISVVEATVSKSPQAQPIVVGSINRSPRDPNAQSASTAALLAKDPAAAPGLPNAVSQDQLPPPQPVTIVAQTPLAAAALQSRQDAIRVATSGKEERGRTSPRKF